MRKLMADVVQETTVTAGAGALTLAQSTGWARFSDRFAVNDLVYYSIRDGNNWEVGLGTVGAANTLARTTPMFTLVAGVANAAAPAAMALSGSSAIVRAVVSEYLFDQVWKIEHVLKAVSFTAADGFAYGITGNAVTATLPAAPLAGDRVRFFEAAVGTTGFVVNPGAEKINGVAGNMTVDVVQYAFTLVYINAALGWKVDK